MNAFHRVLDPGNPAQIQKGLCALAVMTKAPQAGKVKTRLTPPLSPEEAAALNTCFLRDTAAAIAKTAGGKDAAAAAARFQKVGGVQAETTMRSSSPVL